MDKDQQLFIEKLKNSNLWLQAFDDEVILLRMMKVEAPKILYVDMKYKLKIGEKKVPIISMTVAEKGCPYFAFCIVSLVPFSESNVKKALDYLKTIDELKDLKLIVGPFDALMTKSFKETFNCEYTSSYYHFRQMVNYLWREGKMKDYKRQSAFLFYL